MLVLEEVHKTYHMGETEVHALRGVDLTIEDESFVVVMGPSGSGKSTLMHLVGCLDTPTKGHVIYDGADLGALSSRQRANYRADQVGFVFQKFNLVGTLTALENVELPLLLQDAPAGVARDKAAHALESVGLKSRMKHRPSKLSGGEQQRVAIARALVNEPRWILADEPTGNLDTTTGEYILGLLEGFVGEDRSVMLVTHNPEIAKIADVLVEICDGQIESLTKKSVKQVVTS
ncbi:ABC transporter ATP-binding protein [Candidatus Bipolaricaulota bacterium]|nr:ABC transporter ATP-binding protein [Candidatus Bipolaricaulota bacterium]